MAAPEITPLPTPPSRGDAPDQFSGRADALLGSLPGMVSEINAATEWVGDQMVVVEDAAAAADAALGAAHFKGEWAGLSGTLAIPASVSHEGGVWILKNAVADVSASEPSVSDDWISATAVNRYELASLFSTATLDLSLGNCFTVDASSPRTLTLTNLPGSARAMPIVITIEGGSAVSFTNTIRWDRGAVPVLGSTWSQLTILWDGTTLTGRLGAAA